MKIKLDKHGIMPTRGHATDAGLDIYSPEDFTLKPHERIFVDTGVHIQLPAGTVGLVKSRSGMMKSKGVTTDGVVDEGYTGSIGVCLFNHSDEWLDFYKGDRIAQLVVLPSTYVSLEIVDELEATERGDCGFGSTGV